ncbi:MAG TPA: c-type cytochrome, partial [Pirellulaceae bacterium]
ARLATLSFPDHDQSNWDAVWEAYDVPRIEVTALPQRMAYGPSRIAARANRALEIVFRNDDEMPHNWVLGHPGSLAALGAAADALAADPEGPARGYLPSGDNILAASPMLEPRHTASVVIHLPKGAADYPYLCTYPGHWRRMVGVLRTAPTDEEVAHVDATGTVESILGIAATQTSWTAADLMPLLLERPSRPDFQAGSRVFTQASCSACHQIQGRGGKIGPDLTDVALRRKPEEIVRELLHPSEAIEEMYKPWLFITRSGRVVRGIVARETTEAIHVTENPLLACEPVVVRRDEIDWNESKRSEISTMPDGLLASLSREQIQDLLAFLQAGGDAKHAIYEEP